MMFGWIAALVIAAVAGGVYFKVRSQKNAEAAAFAAHEAEVKEVVDHIKSLDITQASQANELITYAKSKEELWQGSSNEVDIANLVVRAKGTIESEKNRAEVEDTFAGIQKELEQAGALSSEELSDRRRRLEQLETKARLMDLKDLADKALASRRKIDRLYADAVLAEAKEAAAGGIDAERSALTKYARTEDELLKLFEAARGNKAEPDLETFFRERYQRCITESDVLCADVWPLDVAKKAPARDLLSAEEFPQWHGPSSLKGFSFGMDKGVMRIVGPASDAKADGIVSIGDREQWRDFVLEMEFTLVKGKADIYLRLGQVADSRVESFPIDTSGPHALVAGEKYKAEISFIGSKLGINVIAEGFSPQNFDVKWIKSRKGALGIVVPEETELLISRMRIRVLR